MMKKIRVVIKNDQKEVTIPTGMRMIIRRCCCATIKLEHAATPAQVCVTFVDDKKIRELNAKYRNKDAVTDVLSFSQKEGDEFPKDPETGFALLGDIVISAERALEQADKFGHTFQREVAFLTAHALLHIFGYEHENGGMKKVRMREKEEQIMVMLGLPSTASYVLEDQI